MSASNSQSSSASNRFSYLIELLKMHMERRKSPSNFGGLLSDLDIYNRALAEAGLGNLEKAKTMEIGVGQRPYRYIAVQSISAESWGIDLDKPVLKVTPISFFSIWKSNGLLRAIKSAVRSVFFDGTDYAAFKNGFRNRFGKNTNDSMDRVLVGNAADPATWAVAGGRFDLIYSEDVFEHIPESDLEKLLPLMAEKLSPNGVAVVAPMIYTGISGDHLPQWYPGRVSDGKPKDTPAWGHLTGEAGVADTYLNKLSRADYRRLFSQHFQILSETVDIPDLGREHLEDRRTLLEKYSEDELFSNKVSFVLRPKRIAATAGNPA